MPPRTPELEAVNYYCQALRFRCSSVVTPLTTNFSQSKTKKANFVLDTQLRLGF